MKYANAQRLIAADKHAILALRNLIELTGMPPTGTPEDALLKRARAHRETTRLAVLADLHKQLRET
jgi:hypothetical protein